MRLPIVAWADSCYLACVRPDPLTGAHGILAHSSDLDRVSEQDEEVDEGDRRTWVEVQEKQLRQEEVDSSEESEEEEEEEDEEEEGDEVEEVSPVQTYGWFEKPFQGRDPVELVSSISLPTAALIPPTKLEDSNTCSSVSHLPVFFFFSLSLISHLVILVMLIECVFVSELCSLRRRCRRLFLTIINIPTTTSTTTTINIILPNNSRTYS